MKWRGSDTYITIKKVEYRLLSFYDKLVIVCDFDGINSFEFEKNQIEGIYRTRNWIKIRGCEALYKGISEGYVQLDVRPSIDVEILEAKEVDRGVYHAQLPVSEIESMWEERMPYLDFPFPEGLATREELEIPK
jgi:hypothetical protein